MIAQVTIDDFGHLPGGTDPETFTREMDSLAGGCDRAELLGRPQGHAGDHRADDAVHLQADERHAQRRRAEARGRPQIYLCSPEYMAQYARRMLWAGVQIIGGCCGTTPEHIKLIRSETRSLQPMQKKLAASR